MLKKAQPIDKDAWVKLNRAFMEFEIQDDNLWNNIDKTRDEELGKVFDEALETPKLITIFMIEDQGEIVGFTNLMTIYSVWSKGLALIIDDLYIDEGSRGKGLGKQTMEEIENYARSNGYKRLQFQSEETNPKAKAFYTKIGYTPAAMSFYMRYL